MTDSKRMRVTEPRGDTTPEWEVFLRADRSESLRHVGSVSAPSADVAREQASSLFGWTAHTLWVCPAEDVVRFTERELGESRSGESAGTEAADPATDDGTRSAATGTATDGDTGEASR
ncbi:Htur_1727 family rSAM-partnered candidate RiPP [Halobellus limi]|uniref:RSAM-partnered protein, Htur_1727 family n=2 Tax=Halobellus limi TaxID=699433 RepID=A0A1H6AVS2_9EURY|nr:Htur_1727 family rSAM-partnered candidate RiPP [Halobellus limi]SEG52711.1 rSAM-partnered protein, Htur_1727 family [Halobellus limi]